MSEVSQAWYILQANAIASSPVVEGPFFNPEGADSRCEAIADSNPGVAYIVVLTVGGYACVPPRPQPALVTIPITLTAQPGSMVLQTTPAPATLDLALGTL